MRYIAAWAKGQKLRFSFFSLLSFSSLRGQQTKLRRNNA